MSGTWTEDGLVYAQDQLSALTEDVAREEGETLDEFTEWVHQQRFAALDAYYTSDRTDYEAYGEAIALLNVNHKLAAGGVDVEHRSTWPEERDADPWGF